MEYVRRTVGLLRVLSQHPEGASINMLSKTVGMPAATTHRVLRCLIDEGLVTQQERGGRYALGPGILKLASGFLDTSDFVSTGSRYLRQATAETGETSFLTQKIGDRAVCVRVEDGLRSIRFFIRPGQEMPFHAAASAQAIIAYTDEEYVRNLLEHQDFRRFTNQTPSSVEEILRRLKVVRAQGFAVCERELDEDTFAVATPVWRMDREVVGSLAVVAPVSRLDDTARQRMTSVVQEAAQGLSSELQGG